MAVDGGDDRLRRAAGVDEDGTSAGRSPTTYELESQPGSMRVRGSRLEPSELRNSGSELRSPRLLNQFFRT
jgi:hypothetical protein